jgi:hypothetical protein
LFKFSGRSGSEIACSSPSHLPKSINLHRCEQNGPYFPANQSPDFLQTGHLIRRLRSFGFRGNLFDVVDDIGGSFRRCSAAL